MANIRLNKIVYVLPTYSNGDFVCLSKQTVYMKNKTDFIVEDSLDDCVIDECRRSYNIEDDFNIAWFKSLKDARQYVASKNRKLKKVLEGVWEII